MTHQRKYGKKPKAPFHAHAYDAAMIIFEAIKKIAKTSPDGTLNIGRQALRDDLYATKNYNGLSGNITCDEFGDCAKPNIGVYQTMDKNVKDLVMPKVPIRRPW